MLNHPHLKTLTVHTDWDLPLVNQLCELAIYYYDFGCWDGIRDAALAILANNHIEDTKPIKSLKVAYNAWLRAKEIVDFDFEVEVENLDNDLIQAENHLAKELLEFYADPTTYIIVRAVDEYHGDEAWFLCYLEDSDELRLDKDAKA